MILSLAINYLMKLSNKKQIDIADLYGKSKQSINIKFKRVNWSANDLVKIADYCEAKLMFVTKDGDTIIINQEPPKGVEPLTDSKE